MINFKKTMCSAALLAAGSVMFYSCNTQEDISVENQIPENVSTSLSDMGYAVDDLQLVNKVLNPLENGKAEPVFVLEGDINIPASQMDEFLAPSETLELPSGEQYRTNALVSSPRTISVIGYTGSGFALTSKMRTGLQWAVSNYNRLNIGLTFTVSFAASTNADMVVYNNGRAGGGGSAGFPSNGSPNKFIQINAGTDSFSTNANEHVITHEMGHSIGFRHTDYFDRRLSCGVERDANGNILNPNEGASNVGAIRIPGTPSGNDTSSLMRACFDAGTSGEFGSNDIVALEFMY